MDLGTHAGFMSSPPMRCLAVVIGLVLWVVIDSRSARKQTLSELEDARDHAALRTAKGDTGQTGRKSSEAAKA
jgi:hypothetical protein